MLPYVCSNFWKKKKFCCMWKFPELFSESKVDRLLAPPLSSSRFYFILFNFFTVSFPQPLTTECLFLFQITLRSTPITLIRKFCGSFNPVCHAEWLGDHPAKAGHRYLGLLWTEQELFYSLSCSQLTVSPQPDNCPQLMREVCLFLKLNSSFLSIS